MGNEKDMEKEPQNDKVKELILLQTNSKFQNVGSKIPFQNLSYSPQVNLINLLKILSRCFLQMIQR